MFLVCTSILRKVGLVLLLQSSLDALDRGKEHDSVRSAPSCLELSLSRAKQLHPRQAAEVHNFLVDSGLQPAVGEVHVEEMTWTADRTAVQVRFEGAWNLEMHRHSYADAFIENGFDCMDVVQDLNGFHSDKLVPQSCRRRTSSKICEMLCTWREEMEERHMRELGMKNGHMIKLKLLPSWNVMSRPHRKADLCDSTFNDCLLCISDKASCIPSFIQQLDFIQLTRTSWCLSMYKNTSNVLRHLRAKEVLVFAGISLWVMLILFLLSSRSTCAGNQTRHGRRDNAGCHAVLANASVQDLLRLFPCPRRKFPEVQLHRHKSLRPDSQVTITEGAVRRQMLSFRVSDC